VQASYGTLLNVLFTYAIHRASIARARAFPQ
jgi:hypothetical protein